MISILYIIVAVLGAIIGGAGLVALIYMMIDYFSTAKLKKKANLITKQEALNPGKVKEIDIKEVQEDDRRRFEKFREFEKLRREGQNGKASPTTDATEPIYKSSFGEPQRSFVENKVIRLDEPDKPKHTNANRTVHLD
jgi:hypothetical protein